MNNMKSTMEPIKHGEPMGISPWFKRLLESMPPVKEKPLTKKQWAKLSPTVKEMIRKGEILFMDLQRA